MSEHQPSERNRRLAANILAGKSPLDDAMLRTLRANALADLNVPPPRVLQLIDEIDRLRVIEQRARDYVMGGLCGNIAEHQREALTALIDVARTDR
jgi:hypothetical protein